MNVHGKFACVLALSFSMAALLAGCTSQSTAQAKAQQAYLAGQNAALRQNQVPQFPSVLIVGQVQNAEVPWVVGLTLAQAVATANYQGEQAPKEIVITRHGESASVDPNVLLNGTEVPLEIGDLIELHP